MPARGDAAEDGMARGDRQALGARRVAVHPAGSAACKDEPSEAVGERRLADPGRAGEQPGMGEAAGNIRVKQRALGRLLAMQVGVRAGRETGRSAVFAHSFTPKRSATARRSAACTSSTVPRPSMTRQRAGSWRAI